MANADKIYQAAKNKVYYSGTTDIDPAESILQEARNRVSSSVSSAGTTKPVDLQNIQFRADTYFNKYKSLVEKNVKADSPEFLALEDSRQKLLTLVDDAKRKHSSADVQSYLKDLSERLALQEKEPEQEEENKYWNAVKDFISGKTAAERQAEKAASGKKSPYSSSQEMAEILGVGGMSGDPEDVAKSGWAAAGVDNAADYRAYLDEKADKVTDYIRGAGHAIVSTESRPEESAEFQKGTKLWDSIRNELERVPLRAESALDSTVGAVESGAGAVTQLLANIGTGTGTLLFGGEGLKRNAQKAAQYWTGALNANDTLTNVLNKEAASMRQSAEETQKLGAEGYGTFGRLVNNAEIAGFQMLGDALAALATGGSSMSAMMVRSFGNGVQEAQDKGYDIPTQISIGITTAATEYFTEKLFGGNPVYDSANNVIGTDDMGLVTRAIQKLGGSKDLLDVLGSRPLETLNEAWEEIAADILDPIADYIISGKFLRGEKIEWPTIDQMIEDGIVGFMLGAAGNGVNAIGEAPINRQAKKLYGPSAEALVEEALSVDPENADARGMKAYLEYGGTLSGREIRELIGIVEDYKAENPDVAEDEAPYAEEAPQQSDRTYAAIASVMSNPLYSQEERQSIISSILAEQTEKEEGTDSASEEDYARDVSKVTESPTRDVTGVNTPVAENGVSEAKTASTEARSVTEPVNAVLSPEERDKKIKTLSKKYGEQAEAFVSTYKAGDESISPDEFASGYSTAYEMGMRGASLDYTQKSAAVSPLSSAQAEIAWRAGRFKADSSAKIRAERNAAGAVSRRAGEWKTGSVTFDDTYNGKGTEKGTARPIERINRRFNKTQKQAVNIFRQIAKATGINIVLYESAVDEKGNRTSKSWGEYSRSSDPGTIYVDISAGVFDDITGADLANYTALRTFTHEFVHFCEKWNPVRYEELRRAVFEHMESNGTDTDALVAKYVSGGMSEEAASREVVAESLTDVLRDASFVEELYNEHKSLFDKLLFKLKEFLADIREYFSGIAKNSDSGAMALQTETDGAVRYVQSIVDIFDATAKNAVESFQATQRGYSEVSLSEMQSRADAEVANGESVDVRSMAKTRPAVQAEPETATAESEDSQERTTEIPEDATQNVVDNAEPVEDNSSSEPVNVIEEVNENGESENGVDTRGMDESDQRGEGSSRLLEGVPTEVLQGDGGERSASSEPEAKWAGNDGSDAQSDADGSEPVRGKRDRVGGRVRSQRSVTAETTEEQESTLREETEKEVETKSTVSPKGENLVIGESLDLPAGEKARIRTNIDAIKIVKQLAEEGRTVITAEERTILSKYVGWGGLPNAFGRPVNNRDTRTTDYVPDAGYEELFNELKEVLSPEEYEAARSTTQNAHYTSIEVIKAMYGILDKLGFNGGRMLEPSCGVGHFAGAMPSGMQHLVNSWTMVEIDSITGQIAKLLYPNNDVRIQGFQDTNIPDGYMDVAIGNVPFSQNGVVDKSMPKHLTSTLHNYFFAKALRKVHDGGIVMFITSRFTMDARDSSFRKYIMQQANVLGAIRLPNSAFKSNAGTSVVTDILILQKKSERTENTGIDITDSDYHTIPSEGRYYAGDFYNDYFADHPEMVLGTVVTSKGMHRADEFDVRPKDGESLGKQIEEAAKSIQGRIVYQEKVTPEQSNFNQQRAKKKNRILNIKDGKIISVDENGVMSEVTTSETEAKKISAMVQIRDAHSALCDALQNGVKEEQIAVLRKKLNDSYDSFVAKYGYLNDRANASAILQFSDGYSILSLEKNYQKKVTADKKTGRAAAPAKAEKSDIFFKDTITKNRSPQAVSTVSEGLSVSMNMLGRVDVPLIARITGQKNESVKRRLIEQRLVFKDKEGNLIPAVQYLSGNVRAKLREAEGIVGIDPDYRYNVDALKDVVPKDATYEDIYVSPGANWIPTSVYEDFVAFLLQRSNHTDWKGKKTFEVEFSAATNKYSVKINDKYAENSVQNVSEWGVPERRMTVLLEALMNGTRVNIYKGPKDARVIDKEATETAAAKMEEIGNEFRKWLWEDETRRKDMEEIFNQVYNAFVTPEYNGESLTINGINPEYALRAHQSSAVQRILSSGGNTLLAHRVGAGKTLEMAAAAMKLKELGIVKKPMFVVPNNVVAQWGKEFKDYFPAANILVIGDTDMSPSMRMTTINKIKNNDYDAVILAYTKFESIQMTKEWRKKFYREQIDDIIFALNAENEMGSKNGKGFSVKELEKKKAALETKFKALESAKDEDGAMFEDLGVDSLFVDEAHNFKNLFFTSRMSNVSGIGDPKGSQRSFDLYTKIRYLQSLNGGRGIVFATATPVMNSMVEMYTMQRYLQPAVLEQLGIDNFDAWAKMYGEVVNELEIKPTADGYRIKQSFSRFKNLRSLQQLFRSFTDVVTEIPGLKIPKMKGGKVQIVESEPSEFQKQYLASLAERSENVRNVDPSVDNLLKITSDGRKIAYTQRMIDPSLPYEEGGKIMKCCDMVFKVWEETKDRRGTQMIFLDMATPKGSDSTRSKPTDDEFAITETESARLYEDIRDRLVELGIPREEIAFIHDAKNNEQKQALSDKMNRGDIRVLLGSTGKMGVGLNAQVKAVAIHHLDAPWRPGDIEQRDGRVFRQKNENDEVYKFVYVTKGSYDSVMWDKMERKQKFIQQALSGEDIGNEMEDTGVVTLSAAEIKAISSGNQDIELEVRLRKQVEKLDIAKKAYDKRVKTAKKDISYTTSRIASLETKITELESDLKSRKDTYRGDAFSMTVEGKTYTERKQAGLALVKAFQKSAKEGTFTVVGSFAGFKIAVSSVGVELKGKLIGKGSYDVELSSLDDSYNIRTLSNTAANLDAYLSKARKMLSEEKSNIEILRKIADSTFEKEEELRKLRAEHNEVLERLNPSKEQTQDFSEEDETQYQARPIKYQHDDDIQEDIEYPEDTREASAFIRSYANKTSGLVLKKGQHKNILIFTANNLYFAKATGYLRGRIDRVIPILGNENLISTLRREFTDGIDEGRETSDTWTKAIQHDFGRYSRHSSRIAETGTADRTDALDVGSYESDELGYNWENFGYPTRDELIDALKSGVLIADDNGNTLTIDGDGYVLPELDSQKQLRPARMSNEEILGSAASLLAGEKLSSAEQDALSIFNKRLDKLNELLEERRLLGQQYREAVFTKDGDRSGKAAMEERMKALDSKIKAARESVLDAERKDVLVKLLEKSRTVIEKADAEKAKDALARYRDRRDNAKSIKKYRDRIRLDTDALSKWILSPMNKNALQHVPEPLKKTVIPFLNSIDFTSKRQLRGGEPTKADNELLKTMRALQTVLNNANNGSVEDMYSGYMDLPPTFMDDMNASIEAIEAIIEKNNGGFVINLMTSEELKKLSKVVKAVKKLITDMNIMHRNAVFQHSFDAGESSISFMQDIGDRGTVKKSADRTNNFLFWRQMRPAYAFERFGDGGKSVYDEFRDGQSRLAFNTKKITEFSDKAYTEKEVKEWEKETNTFEIDGKKLVIPVSYLMGFYELLKRPQAANHIRGDGIRVATYTSGGKKVQQEGVLLTEENIRSMVDSLTDRQKEVADTLQKFMAEVGGKWGNYVSMIRFGEEQFGDPNYYPINSDGRNFDVKADEKPGNASLYALLNMSFTKDLTKEANNRIILYSIFDVFANHMSSMAQYNAFALPVLDALKWFNYRQQDGTSVREQMTRVYGAPTEGTPGSGRRGYAEDFVIGILKAFNGTEAQGAKEDNFVVSATHRYNAAQIAFNLRVVLQQPLAITRAGMLHDTGSILRGMKLSPAKIKANIAEMQRMNGIAAWKALGFYDVNISRSVSELIKHDQSIGDKLVDKGTAGAELMDNITWAAIWAACKEQVTKDTGLKNGEDGYFKAVNKLFDDVIYKTQVVDSVLTKSEFLRDKSVTARVLGSFMSESTATASMLLDTYDKYRMDKQRGMSNSDAWRKHKSNFAKTFFVYVVSQVLLAAAQSVPDAARDDDDYETFLQKWLEAFRGNLIDELMPINKLPYLSDAYDLFKKLLEKFGVDTYGNEPTTAINQMLDYSEKAIDVTLGKLSGDSKYNNYRWYYPIFKGLQVISGMTGIPMAAATREVVTIWNNTVAQFAPSLKIYSYESNPMNKIKYAYMDGNLTDAQAIKAIFDAGLETDSDKTAELVRYWNFLKTNPKYDDVSQAAVTDYFDIVEKTGIPFDRYMRYRSDIYSISGEDTQKQVWNYINSLMLTKAQKDALHLIKYKQATLKNAPWH